MKLGVFTVVIPEYSPEETVRILKETGYDGVEWRIGREPPQQKPNQYTYENRYWTYNRSTLNAIDIDSKAKDIKKICDDAELEICSLATYTRPWDEADIERILKAANSMSCSKIRVLAPEYDGKENYCTLFDKTKAQLSKLEKMAKIYGVKILLEQHMGTIIPSASASYRLVSDFDPQYIGIIFDPGNMVFEGYEDYRITTELLGKYIGHVHVKNAAWKQIDPAANGSYKWQADWAPIKKGYVDFTKVIASLRAIGYDDYLSLEDFSNEVDTDTKLKESQRFLTELLKTNEYGRGA